MWNLGQGSNGRSRNGGNPLGNLFGGSNGDTDDNLFDHFFGNQSAHPFSDIFGRGGLGGLGGGFTTTASASSSDSTGLGGGFQARTEAGAGAGANGLGMFGDFHSEEWKAPPPTSTKTLATLPEVKVTSDDLQEETNRTCCVCLEDHNLGEIASKLPCGHIFHPRCIKEWLVKTCTCPVCRFELETDSTVFERDRKRRMGGWRQRYRVDELRKLKVSRLKEIMTELSIPTPRGSVDKNFLVEQIARSGKVTITESLPPVRTKLSQLRALSVGALMQLMAEKGLDAEGVLEKEEIIDILSASDRFEIVAEDIDVNTDMSTIASSSGNVKKAGGSDGDSGSAGNVERERERNLKADRADDIKINQNSFTAQFRLDEQAEEDKAVGEVIARQQVEEHVSSSAKAEAEAEAATTSATAFSFSGADVGMDKDQAVIASTKDLISIAKALGLDYRSCLERSELLHLLRKAGALE